MLFSLLTTAASILGPKILSRVMGGGILDRLTGIADRYLASANDAKKLELEEFKATVEGAKAELAERADYMKQNPVFWSRIQAAFIWSLYIYWLAILVDSLILWWVKKHSFLAGTTFEKWNAAALPEPMMTWAGWMIGFLFFVSMWKGRR